MHKLIPGLILIAFLGGCAVHPVPVIVKPAGGGGFCPPGQAKKGNC